MSHFNEIVQKNIKPGIIVAEVGVLIGDLTVQYAPLVKDVGGTVYAVDWFCGNVKEPSSHIHGYKPEKADEVYNIFLDRLKQDGLEDTVKIVRGCSYEMAPQLPLLDICFLDAGHTYENVIKDIEAYLPKIKVGGILCGHDFEGYGRLDGHSQADLERECSSNGHIGVIKAVWDKFGDSIEHVPDDIWLKRVE